MLDLRQSGHRAAAWVAGLSSVALFTLFFAAVALSHLTLLRLPYYWDEGGYYIPAALDFYYRHALIPQFTNAHPPLPNVVLGTAWHIFGYNILTTRLVVCAFAAAGLVAVFRLGQWLGGASTGVALSFLTALYPIWFAQSTLAHADMFAAAFTLWAFAFYFAAQTITDSTEQTQHRVAVAVLFSLAAVSKETSIVQPAALAATHLVLAFAAGHKEQQRRYHLRWFISLCAPVLPLLAWYGYHRAETGFMFGNPEYLRYNATANFSVTHIFTALRYRFVHLAWQRNIWFPIVLAVACLLFLRKLDMRKPLLPVPAMRIIVVLLLANWIAFSVLGGALLTRYLLPMYPLILLVCIASWKATTRLWALLAACTAAPFLLALWWSPSVAYAPEDCLTYRDMIVVHQQAIAFLDQHFPDARVLTAWPAAAELFRPDLGYTDHRIMGPEIDDFSSAQIVKAAQEQGSFDTALVFSKNFVAPVLRAYLLAHPDSAQSREYARHRDLTAAEIAAKLGGTVVFYRERNGEWAAILRFPRRYDAGLSPV